MEQFYIRVITRSPLTVRIDHAVEGAGTTGYIPGTTLAGALASVHRLLRPRQTEQFEQWFLSGHIQYPNLYPAIFDDDSLQNNNVPVFPVPRTAQTCKRHEGFLFPKKEENDAHGVRDSLIDWAIFELAQHNDYKAKNIDPLIALEEHKVCDRCHERMDAFKGFYRRNDRVKKQLIVAKERRRLSTHTGIDRESGTVQEGILYNRQVFEEDMRFWGMARFPVSEQFFTEFRDFIDEICNSKAGNEGLLRLGTGRTRGMGKITIDVDRPRTQQNSFATFQQRLNTFDKLMHEQAEAFQLNGLQHKFFFALTLHSPLILADELLRYRGNIDASVFEHLLNTSIPALEQLYRNARTRRITGWQELWGVPRTNEYAIDMGSVFLFSCSSPLSDEAYKALFALEEQGVGKRQGEGFGRICISDEFHQEVKVL